MLGSEARASVSVHGCLARPGMSPPVPGCGDSFGPVRDRIGDRYCRGRSCACGREFLVVAGLAGGDRGQAPNVEQAPQLTVTRRGGRGVYCPVVLAEKILVFSV